MEGPMSWACTLKQGLAGAALALPLLAGAGQQVAAESVLRVVMHSDLKIVDPIWTTAYITRNHGYMIYDTLFAMDSNLKVTPQMVDKWTVSADKLTYTFTLRDGLAWHDGAPVTSEDCIASIKRWGSKDSMGQKLLQFVKDMKAVDAKTFTLELKEAYGLVLLSLAKPSSNVPFMMPKRVAETPGSEQIKEYVGSGPFVFKTDEWKPGDKTVYVKNTAYKPRSEASSAAAGAKVAKVDRVEWLAIPDHQTAVNALVNGEIDIIESPPHDLYPVLESADNVALVNTNPLGNQYMFRMNHLHPPFDNQKVRQAALAALNQEDFLQAVIGNPKYYKVCPAMFVCETPFAFSEGGVEMVKSDFEKSKRLLKEAGYDGTPVTLMHSTDLAVLANLAPVAADLLRKGGFTVDMQSMDWQTLVSRRSKKEKPADGGWNAFLTSWVAADILNPTSAAGYNTGCDKAWFGWPCDEKMEQMRDSFARETNEAEQREIAKQIQIRAMEIGTHGHAGQWYQAMAVRKDRIDGLLSGPAPFFWNVTKKGG
jgi:peptide/nickel transport system substrate-binding protein